MTNWAESVDRSFSRSVDDSMSVLSDSLNQSVDSSVSLMSDSVRLFTNSVRFISGTLAIPAIMMSAMTGVSSYDRLRNEGRHEGSEPRRDMSGNRSEAQHTHTASSRSRRQSRKKTRETGTTPHKPHAQAA